MKHYALIAVAIAPFVVCEATSAEHLKPTSVDRFYVTPEKTSVLQWQLAAGRPDQALKYTIRDYGGKTVATGEARTTSSRAVEVSSRTVEVSVKLSRGFFDVEFPATGERFGIVSLPAYRGKTDAFFCIDSAMSWLVQEDDVREGLIRALRRSGVVMSRERLGWGAVCPNEETRNWDASQRYETLRRAHAKHGIEVLEMFHDSPRWTGLVGKYPDDLVKTARAWKQIATRWQTTWGALEVWNEPDIHFGDLLPADQYVPLVRTIARVFAQAEIDRPLVGGVVAHCNRTYLDNAARNGLLDCTDAFSFHTYGRAPQMESLVTEYRSWLKAHGRESMPLWLTECGRPWKRGPDRPPSDQGAESALDITMKGVEARACGVARYFPFVYPYYEERSNNFGMVGRRATPLRPMAAYTRLVSLLAHKRYLGDLPLGDQSVQRARVFGDDRETIAVLYAQRPDPQTKVNVSVPVRRAEGIDGRVLAVDDDGAVPVPDGLTYVWLDRRSLGNRLQTETAAMRLSDVAGQPAPKRGPVSPLVPRLQMDPSVLRPVSEGYRIAPAAAKRFALQVRVFNLAETPHTVRLTLAMPEGAELVDSPQSRTVQLAGEAFSDAGWRMDLSGAFARAKRVSIKLTAAGKGSVPASTLHVDLEIGEK